jgi:mono/diheme cytochrome c family protein
MKDFILILITMTLAVSNSSCSGDIKSKQHSSQSETTTIGVNSAYDKLIDSALYHRGEAIFRLDCNACHVVKNKLHNYLEGVVDRVGKDYLKLYLTKQDSLVFAKDNNALMLKRMWNNMANSHNFKYTEEELNAIIEYLK